MTDFDLDEHAERTERRGTWPGAAHPSAKQRTSAHAAVRRVLDALAPETAPPRGAALRGEVQRFRSPRGCILQGSAHAVSVSWFAASGFDAGLGELHVIAWDGIVSRPGAAQPAAGGARPKSEVVLTLEESPTDAMRWRAADGATFDDAALVSQCLHMLDRGATAPIAAD